MEGFEYHPAVFANPGQDLATIALASATLLIASAGGIGGGGVLVPLYILVSRFHPKHAIALSNITILGGAIANTSINVWKRHPYQDRQLIDWDLIVIMEPLTIFGAIFGSLVSKVVPTILLNSCLVIILLWVARHTLWRARRLWRDEARKEADAEPAPPSKDAPANSSSNEAPRRGSREQIEMMGCCSSNQAPRRGSQPQIDVLPVVGLAAAPPAQPLMPVRHIPQTSCSHRDQESNSSTGVDGSEAVDFERRDSLKKAAGEQLDTSSFSSSSRASGARSASFLAASGVDVKQLDLELQPFRAWADHASSKVFLLIMCLLGTCALTLLRGGGRLRPLPFECGSWAYWLLYFSAAPWVLGFAMFFRRRLLLEYNQKAESGYQFGAGEVQWTEANTLRYPAICALSGLFAGMFGVGGGIVKGPLMLEMGILPLVASASAATMVLFTSAAACVSFIVFGLVHYHYGMLFFGMGFACTLVGQVAFNRCSEKKERQSLIVLSIGLILFLSACLVMLDTTVTSIYNRASLLRGNHVCARDVT